MSDILKGIDLKSINKDQQKSGVSEVLGGF